jgi:hypothetical protein
VLAGPSNGLQPAYSTPHYDIPSHLNYNSHHLTTDIPIEGSLATADILQGLETDEAVLTAAISHGSLQDYNSFLFLVTLIIFWPIKQVNFSSIHSLHSRKQRSGRVFGKSHDQRGSRLNVRS